MTRSLLSSPPLILWFCPPAPSTEITLLPSAPLTHLTSICPKGFSLAVLDIWKFSGDTHLVPSLSPVGLYPEITPLRDLPNSTLGANV